MAQDTRLTDAIQTLRGELSNARSAADWVHRLSLKRYQELAHDCDVDDSPQPSEAAAMWWVNLHATDIKAALDSLLQRV